MKRRFMKQALLGVAALVVGFAFAGCGEDYDDSALKADISAVRSELATAKTSLEKALEDRVSGIKDEVAADAIKRSVDEITELLKGGTDEEIQFIDLAPILGQLIALSEDLAEVANALNDIDGALDGVTRAKDLLLTREEPAKLTWSKVLVDYHKRIAKLEIQAAVLGLAGKEDGSYTITGGVLKDIQDEINLLKLGIPEGEGGNYDTIVEALATNDVFIAAIVAQISSTNPDLVTLDGKINALITGLSYAALNANPAGPVTNLTFNVVASLVDYTFGGDRAGAITFATKKTGEGAAIASVYVRVTPAGAKLNKDEIVLRDSKGQTAIDEYVKVYNVEPYTGLIGSVTKADESVSGIYKITFTLGDNYDAKKLLALTTKDKAGADKVQFAIAVETKSTEGNRYVTTDFKTGITATPTKEVIYNTNYYTVNGEPLSGFYNRYNAASEQTEDLKWTSQIAKNNVDATDESTTAADKDDGRKNALKNQLPVSIGEEIRIAVNNDKILAYYVDFDAKFATADELTLWKGADVTGLD
jgi:hypothetical protein